jgi:hypothetical protein
MSIFKSHDLRLSFFWTGTVLDFLKGTAPVDAPMIFLGDDGQYIDEFETSQLDGPHGLLPPWFKPKEDFFWFYYAENTQPKDMSGIKAWKYLIPMRMRVPFKVTAPWLNGRIYLEGFFYPHGIVLVFTAECIEKLSLEEARELSFKIRQNELFRVIFADGSPAQDLHLNPLADRAMTFLKQGALGPDAKTNFPVSPLFSIWTVVRAEGVDPTIALTNGGDVHRVLEAVTTWNPNFATANLPDLASSSARLRKTRSAGDVLYANDRGRAVWFPGTFTLPPEKRSMACYHRNLVYASMQVESLCRFVRETAQEVRQPGDASMLPIQQFNCAKRAAGILTRLYLALKDKTYRSGSPYLQIKQNNFLGDINKIRQETFAGGAPLV